MENRVVRQEVPHDSHVVLKDVLEQLVFRYELCAALLLGQVHGVEHEDLVRQVHDVVKKHVAQHHCAADESRKIACVLSQNGYGNNII